MAKPKSWSVKGIDDDTRRIARNAAQAAGMPIGAWIDQAILKARNGELPDLAVRAAKGSSRELSPFQPVAEAQIPEPNVPEQIDEQIDEISPGPPESPIPASIEEQPEPNTPEPHSPLPDYAETDTSAGLAESDTSVQLGDGAERRPVTADPQDRLANDPPANANEPPPPGTDEIFEPRPLAPVRSSTSPVRYAVAAVLLIALLGGGLWLFVELSSTERSPLPQTIADATKDPASRPGTVPQDDGSRTPGDTRSTPGSSVPGEPIPDEIRTGIKLARAGDAKAQHDLGMLYLSGRYFRKDPAEAAKWFERAAVQGLPNAQFNLGVLYQRGQGVKRNDRLSFFWYQSAAEKGFHRAQHNLATAYADGRGVAQNYQKAVEWFTKAATGGLGASQYSLAALYELGLATGKPDIGQARKWYERAAALGDTKAAERLAALSEGSTVGSPRKAQTEAAASPLSRNEIREIQSLLSAMNFNPGPIDGSVGQRTNDAIRLYQGFAGMEADGRVSRVLLEDLQAVASTMSK